MAQDTKTTHEIDQRWYQNLVESAPDAVILINSEGRIVLVNAQTEKLFGYSRGELLDKTVELLVPERYHSRHSIHRDAYFAEPKVRGMGGNMELWGRRKDGAEFPLEISLSPLRTDRGIYATASIRDVTDRQKAQQQFRALLESAPDAMIIINQLGDIMLVNAQAERMFGYQREALIGKKVEVLVPERLRGAHSGHRGHYFVSPKVRGMGAGLELSGRRKDGSEFPIEISLSPMETESGTWATAAVRDITQRRAVDEELTKYAENLKQSNKELEQFAYVASHDLQAPLRNIVSYTQLLQEEYKPPEESDVHKYMQHIVSSGTQMQALVKDLLAFSRVGRQDSNRMRVDLEDVMNRVIHQHQAAVDRRNAIITHDPLPEVIGSAHELYQLLQNLLDNGLKFQPGDQPRVHVSAVRDGAYWRCSVKDDGIGIKREYQARIFELFQRLHTADEYDGTGIGLALCQKIVTGHGGRIWVESELGSGATFHFTLPAAE